MTSASRLDDTPTMAGARLCASIPGLDEPRVNAEELRALSEELEQYPLTEVPPACDPAMNAAAPSGLTRPGYGPHLPFGAGSDPEVESRLRETMTALPRVGDEFLGFSLLAELGKGAFGCVYLAQQGALAGRLVALKVATGLFDESQTLAQLQHTHIVPIYSYHDGAPFQAVCMPYLGSTTLADVLHDIRSQKSMPNSGREILSTLNDRKRRSSRRLEEASSEDVDETSLSPTCRLVAPKVGPSPLAELEGMSYVDSVLWLALRLADGLAHAHDRGILHRDLKPANILLTDDGVPMLLDFNLAQHRKPRDTAIGAAIGGTLPYMAPEHLEAFRGQARGAVDARSDLYSLGVILFELLTGATPFPIYRKLAIQETIERMIRDRKTGAPSLRELNPSIPHAVESIVLKCLAPDPTLRYQCAEELEEDLQRQLVHLPLKHARNRSLTERFQKFRRRHPRLTSATSVLCGACVVLAAVLGLFAVREEQHLRLEARATLARFDDEAQTTYFLLNARSAKNQVDEGERSCRAALSVFGVLEEVDWRARKDVQRLPGADQQRLQAEVGQLLILLAHARQLAAEREKDAERKNALLEEGVHFCVKASECFPPDETPRALWQQQAELHRRRNERALADQCLERAKKAELKTVQDRYLAARQLAEEGKFRAALPIVREALRMAPQDFNLHFLEGICHDHLGQHARAIECYRVCIALRPGFFASYYNRGLAHLRLSQWDAARMDFDETVRLKEDFADAYLHRALAHQGMKKYREADADFGTALDRGARQTRIYFLRSRVREKLGDSVGAKQDLAEGLKREPADELSWIARGLASIPGDPRRALADFESALEANPRSKAALQNKAHVLAKYLQRTQDAIDTLDQALALYPDDAPLRAGRGVYLARLGKRDPALKDAEEALRCDTSPSNLYQVAGIYALTSRNEPNDRQEAFRLLSSALSKGFGFDYLEIDRDLDPIRDLPAFRRVVDGARALRSAGTR